MFHEIPDGIPPLRSEGSAHGHLHDPVPAATRRVRGSGPKQLLDVTEHEFSDLRSRWPPQDPSALQQMFRDKIATPASPANCETFKFALPPGLDHREARWHLWMNLANIGYFVKELYAGTSHYAHHNCKAGLGAKGQCVVFTEGGTIHWMARTNRLYSPNPRGDILQRMAIFFPPWQPTTDGKPAYDGKWPAVAASANPSSAVFQVNAKPLDFGISHQ